MAALFAGRDSDTQPILGRRQRTGRELRKRARRVLGFVEIQDHFAVLRGVSVQETAGTIGRRSTRRVAKNDEKLVVLGHGH